MTGTTVADAMPTATAKIIINLNCCCRTNKNLQYDLVMSFILIILNVAAILCLVWSAAIVLVEAYDMYIVGRICHIFGFAILLHLLYCISPRLTLWFGIPCSLWFLAAFIEPLYTVHLPPVFEDFRNCWKFVNEEQVRVVTV
ncbi:hypothetical protein HID58_036361 [Brassica napus]|uniref:BnaA09g44860D protein n=3 Tax=Brassica TaxID=3705 RepID=A0A078G5J9_BRANA|nr:hypothetical protein HID58_036361 [Brassica napus]CAF2050343.1 unnamed protein product [Brassica napus]CDY21735.1 BnaA09g44860D [Brassica napus]